MAAGQIGESGAPVVSPAAVAFKDAHELAQILLLEMVVVIAMGITYSPNLAIPMDAQVWNQVLKFIKTINKANRKKQNNK